MIVTDAVDSLGTHIISQRSPPHKLPRGILGNPIPRFQNSEKLSCPGPKAGENRQNAPYRLVEFSKK